ESEEGYRKLIETSPDAILVHIDQKIVFMNPAGLEIIGAHNSSEIMGKSILDLTHPDYLEVIKRRQELLKKGDAPRNEYFKAIRLDGSVIDVETTSARVTYQGKSAIMATIRDITNRLKAEAKLQQYLENLEEEITVRKRMEERIVHLNAVLRAIRKVNQLIVTEKDRDRLLKVACRSLVETRGYYNAWIALLDQSGKLVTTAEAGLGKKFLPLQERWRAGELPHCARVALAEPGVSVIEDPATTCKDCPLAGAYTERWGLSCRLESGGNIYGLLTVSVTADYAADE
ncbi:unnamed protein product, partial [marine sediment metagenome]